MRSTQQNARAFVGKARLLSALSCALLSCVLLCILLCASGCSKGHLLSEAEDHVRSLRLALGGERPTAADFLSGDGQAFCKQNGIAVSYAGAAPDVVAVGQGQLQLLLSRGQSSRTLTVDYSVVLDTQPPVLHGVTDRSVLCGEGLVLREGVSVTDDCFGTPTLTVDTSRVDVSTAGTYPVVYRAVDGAGNATEQTAVVTVYPFEVSEDMLWARVDALLSELLSPEDTKEQICRRVHAYVKENIAYCGTSDKSDRVRAAYMALFVEGMGDCYSYCAAAWALLTRAGIECLEIQRSPFEVGNAHYWLLVDISATGEAERWYHLDATVLLDDGAPDGCLLTDAQIDAYSRMTPGFYVYDRAAYPPSDGRIITPTPQLQEDE